MRNLFFTLLFVLYSVLAYAETDFSMKDIQALYSEKMYKEIVQRAKDLRPSRRTKAWKNIVSESIAGVSKKEGSLMNVINHIEIYPFSISNKKVSKVFLKNLGHYNKECRRNTKFCNEKIYSILSESGDVSFVKKAFDELYSTQSPKSLFPIYQKLDELSVKGFCSLDGLLESLNHTFRQFEKDDDEVSSARSIAFTKCWKPLGPSLKESLSGASLSYMKNTCDLFLKKNVLSGLSKVKCAKVN